MEQWLAVVMSGAVGGAMSTLLPAGTEFPWPKVLHSFFERHSAQALFGHLLRNLALGGMASFVIWGLANPGLNFGTNSVTVGVVAAAIIVGGGGVSALNNLFQQSARIDSRDAALAAAATLVSAETEEDNGESE